MPCLALVVWRSRRKTVAERISRARPQCVWHIEGPSPPQRRRSLCAGPRTGSAVREEAPPRPRGPARTAATAAASGAPRLSEAGLTGAVVAATVQHQLSACGRRDRGIRILSTSRRPPPANSRRLRCPALGSKVRWGQAPMECREEGGSNLGGVFVWVGVGRLLESQY